MARRRIRACSIPSTIPTPCQTDPTFLALLRAALLDLKREQFERTFETAFGGSSLPHRRERSEAIHSPN
ncbi:MAG: hypothetical protein DCF18_10105 [Cyanobium sp.]|uniref:hypothetical protein n=1 Tax=Synechococcus sp. CS-1333 TaxID=2848638 RepID=UPI000DBC0D7B|nr:hypothetical protein [Synechococcus sp. CS-1333]MCT0211150.1 hypothetical protein [Synechococcus sp. CS-1333]PZV22366.1 MAG: hypothetical protein DCF18_10105 [Cyanobium sp.]